MKNKVTCGFLIETDDGYLLCHPSGREYGKGCYDIPKGCKEDGETELDCALRELHEETSITLSEEQIANIKDIGRFVYTKEKDIHLFHIYLPYVDTKKLCCLSELENGNKEHDSFMITNDLKYCFKSLQNVFKLIF